MRVQLLQPNPLDPEHIDHTVLYAILPECDFAGFLKLQQRLWQLRYRQKIPQILIFTTHHPCYSLGSRDRNNPARYFKVPIQEDGGALSCNGIPIVPTVPLRGGGVTYHGPEVLGCYTIFGHLPYTPGNYFEFSNLTLEIFFLSIGLGRPTHYDSTPDLWIANKKLVSMAIRYRTGQNMVCYGFDLNVGGNLTPFASIYPCGVVDEKAGVTSLEQELYRSFDPKDVAEHLITGMADALPDLTFVQSDEEALLAMLELEEFIEESSLSGTLLRINAS